MLTRGPTDWSCQTSKEQMEKKAFSILSRITRFAVFFFLLSQPAYFYVNASRPLLACLSFQAAAPKKIPHAASPPNDITGQVRRRQTE